MAEVRGDLAVKGNLAVEGNVRFHRGMDAPYLELVDRKSKSSSGGTFTQGAWRTRDLTDTNFNDFAIDINLSPSAGTGADFTLTRGVYYCEIECPALNVGEHVARLADVTDNPGDLADVLVLGTSEFSPDTSTWATSVEGELITNASMAQTRSKVTGKFQLTGTRTLEIQHRCAVTQTIDGFGSAADFYQTDNIYTVCKIWRVRDDTI